MCAFISQRVVSGIFPIFRKIRTVLYPFNRQLLKLFTVFCIGTTVYAQDGKDLPVSGRVLSNGQPLSEVNISVKNKSVGTQSDRQGNFTLNTSLGDTLRFSYVGMEPIDLPVSDFIGPYQIEMRPMVNQLDEVVLAGSGFQEKIPIYEQEKETEFTNAQGKIDPRRAGYSIDYHSGEEISTGYPSLREALLALSSSIKRINGTYFMRGGHMSIKNPQPIIWDVDGMIYMQEPPLDIPNVQDIHILPSLAGTQRYGSQATGGVIIVRTNLADLTSSNDKAQNQGNHINKDFFQNDAIGYSKKDISIESKPLLNKADFSKYVDSIGLNIPGLKQLAFACQVKGQHVRAIQLYRQILALSPNDPKASRDLAQAFILIDKPLTAWRMYMERMNQNNGAFDEELGELQFNEIKRLSQTEQLKDSLPGILKDVSGAGENEINTRIVFEWADPASDFSLEIVNPNSQVYETSYGSYEGRKSVEEFYIDSTLKGEWRFNISPRPSIQGPIILKVTIYRNWEQADISKPQIKLYSFDEGDQTKYELLKLKV